MVLRTFTNGAGTGLWSTAGNWDTGVPADTDTFLIPAGLICDFDVDQSAMATGMGDSVITGELRALAGGARYLKMAGHLTGTGVLRAGTSEAVPFTTASSLTIWRGAGVNVDMTGVGSFQLFATHPANRYVRLTANVILGAVIMPVDTDVTADLWAIGDIVAICNINNGYEQQEYTIQAIAANQITLTSGVTTAFIAGSYMILCNRNVRIIGAGGATAGRVTPGSSADILSCEIAYGWYGILGGANARFSGVLHGCYYPVFSSPMITIASACMTRTAGGGAALVETFAPYITDSLLAGCDTGVMCRQGVAINSTFAGAGTAIRRSNMRLINCSLIGNGADLYYEAGQEMAVTFDNCLFTSAVMANRAAATATPQWNDVHSNNHNTVAGAYKGWPGSVTNNVVTSQAVTVPPGYTQADQLVLSSATLPTFRQWALVLQPGEQIEVTARLRKDAAMAYRPRIQVIDQSADPLVDGASAALAETIMTDSVDTWETLTATWDNAGATERRVYVRSLGMNATGNAYAVVEWEVVMGTVATNVATLITRLTELRAGYLDVLATAPATATDVTNAQSAIETAISGIPTVTPPTVEAIRAEIDANSTQLAAILEDTGTTLPAAIDAIPTAAEIDTELTTEHGAGSWQQPTAIATSGGASYSNGTLSLMRGDIYNAAHPCAITGISVPAGYTDILFMIENGNHTVIVSKTLAAAQIVVTDPAGIDLRVDLTQANTSMVAGTYRGALLFTYADGRITPLLLTVTVTENPAWNQPTV